MTADIGRALTFMNISEEHLTADANVTSIEGSHTRVSDNVVFAVAARQPRTRKGEQKKKNKPDKPQLFRRLVNQFVPPPPPLLFFYF